METILNTLNQFYEPFCKRLFGKNLTNVLADAWHVEWWRVHEYLLAMALFLNLVLLVVCVVLAFKLRKTRKTAERIKFIYRQTGSFKSLPPNA